MQEGEPLVWYADSDGPYYTLRRSGGPLVAVFLLPALLVICFAGPHGAALLLPMALVPVAAIVAAWEFAADRRAVVEIRLAGGELTLIRVNRSTGTYPVGEVQRIEVIRSVRGGTPASSRMRLRIGERAERTRAGPADLPERWVAAIIGAEVDLRVREKHYED